MSTPATPLAARGYGGYFLVGLGHAVLQRVKVVGVLLHHIASLVEVEGAVVGSANLVFLHVGKLNLDHIRTKTLLIQECAGYCSETMDAHFVSIITHATQAV